MQQVGSPASAQFANAVLQGQVMTGTATIPAGSAAVDVTVTFAQPFLVAPVAVAQPNAGVYASCTTRGTTTTQTTVRVFITDRATGSSSNTIPFTLIAVGPLV